MNDFKEGSIQILITNDLMCGLDLKNVSLVINYELCNDKWEYYKRVCKIFSESDSGAIAISII